MFLENYMNSLQHCSLRCSRNDLLQSSSDRMSSGMDGKIFVD